MTHNSLNIQHHLDFQIQCLTVIKESLRTQNSVELDNRGHHHADLTEHFIFAVQMTDIQAIK